MTHLALCRSHGRKWLSAYRPVLLLGCKIGSNHTGHPLSVYLYRSFDVNFVVTSCRDGDRDVTDRGVPSISRGEDRHLLFATVDKARSRVDGRTPQIGGYYVLAVRTSLLASNKHARARILIHRSLWKLKVHNLSGRLGMSYIRVCQFILDGPRTITGSQEVQSRTKATGCTSNGMYQKRVAIFLGL